MSDNEAKERIELQIPELESIPENCKKILFMDNCFINYIHELTRKNPAIDFNFIYSKYDLIIITGWCKIEIQDSEFRTEYINKLSRIFPIYIISETNFEKFINPDIDDELGLYHFFYAIAKTNGAIKSIFDNQIYNKDTSSFITDSTSHTWIQYLYDNWPLGKKEDGTDLILKNGRSKKKNAPDYSMMVLAEIFSYSEKDLEIVIIGTDDTGLMDYNKNASVYLEDSIDELRTTSITFLSKNRLLSDLYNEGKINEELLCSFRKNKSFPIYINKSNCIEKYTLEDEIFIELITLVPELIFF